jgi:hypothetical protein
VTLVRAATAILLTSSPAVAQDEPSDLWQAYNEVLSKSKYIDLTHTLTPTQPVWKGFGPSTFAPTVNPLTGKPYTFASDGFEGRAALLSPFDRLVMDRKRLDAIFGFDYLLEMYKPKEQRIWGYYALPILYGDRLVGKLDATAERAEGVVEVKLAGSVPRDTVPDCGTSDQLWTLTGKSIVSPIRFVASAADRPTRSAAGAVLVIQLSYSAHLPKRW